MSSARKAKRLAIKPTPTPATVLTARDASRLAVSDRRLLRACDLLSCLERCQDAELNLGALAIAVRDLLDTVRADLAPLRRSMGKAVRS